MSTFSLKVIAILAMLIDHIGAIFIPQDTPLYLICRSIGRLAFPIFCFLIVEGFYHTRDVKKYIKRLGIFALISEIPFDLAFYHYHFQASLITDLSNALSGENYSIINRLFGYQNVFFTLFFGLILITIMSYLDKKYKNEMLLLNIYNALVTIGFCAIAVLIRSDYSLFGILLIVAFYLFRQSNALCGISILLILGFLQGDLGSGIFALISIFFIRAFNGTKGKDVKYLFYIFYPAHLLVLYLISLFL